jgi:hypothetical protein
MALKYWYKAANGSDNWAVAGNWYNGSGGTGGTTTVPTAADDVIIDAASGSGTITIAAAATCLSLDCTGFTGTLAGTSTLAFLGNITLSATMALTYSGTATLGNGYSNFTSNGKTVTFNITVNNAGAGFFVNGNLTMSSTNTLTLSSGLISQFILSDISVGFFVSTGSAARVIDNIIYLTGIGTVWSVSGTNFGNNNIAYITNASSSAKTISHTATTASATFGGNFRQTFYITGAGTGSYTLTGNFQDLYFANTGGASFSFGNSNIAGTLDLGYSNPTCNMVWNNGATTLTWNADDALTMSIGQNITITASPALSYTNAVGYSGTINNPYNKFLTGAITVNGTGLVSPDNLRTTGTITVTSGLLQSNDVYCSSISSSNANTRDITIYGILYLTGTGTLATVTTTTNLTVAINNIYVTNSSATSKSLTLNSVFYPNSGGGVYLAGSGSGTMTLSAGISAAYPIYVTNTGGAPISFSTATILSIEFSAGTNAVWSNATSQTLTITDSLFISASAGNPTLTPALIFTGSGSGVVNVTLSGKSLVGGTCILNDTSYSANSINYIFDGFSSNAAFTVTSAGSVIFNGAFNGPSYTSTSAAGSDFNSSLTLTGTLSLANNAQSNSVQVYGNFSAATISHLAIGGIYLFGTTNNVTTSITLNNTTTPSYFYHSGALTTGTITITNGYLDSYANINCTTITVGAGLAVFQNNIVTLTGIFTLTSGDLYASNTTFSSTTFVCSAVANSRVIGLSPSSCSWTLTGTGTVWNLVDGGTLTANVGLLDIYITNTSVTAITFAGASQTYRRLFINRGAINTNQVTITGSNFFQGLYHTGGSTQTLIFPAGIDTYIVDTFAIGSSSAVTNISSSSSSVPFNLIKVNPGLVICNNVSITRSAAYPADTWYAINSTNVAGNSGWIFSAPSRRLSSLGTG